MTGMAVSLPIKPELNWIDYKAIQIDTIHKAALGDNSSAEGWGGLNYLNKI